MCSPDFAQTKRQKMFSSAKSSVERGLPIVESTNCSTLGGFFLGGFLCRVVAIFGGDRFSSTTCSSRASLESSVSSSLNSLRSDSSSKKSKPCAFPSAILLCGMEGAGSVSSSLCELPAEMFASACRCLSAFRLIDFSLLIAGVSSFSIMTVPFGCVTTLCGTSMSSVT